MIRSELTIQLPPATLKGDGAIIARSYPLHIACRTGAVRVAMDDVYISPSSGVIEVQVSGAGVVERRHTIGAVQTALPQASADELSPLTIQLANLNPDASTQVVIVMTTTEYQSRGPGELYGGAVRFQGRLPLGTDGKREPYEAQLDVSGSRSVSADGPYWYAALVTNGALITRSIRDITGQTRVLAPSGTGNIPVSGGSTRVIIVKKEGVVLEAQAESLDFGAIFSLTTSSGSVSIIGLAAASILAGMLAPGAVNAAALGTDAVTTDKVQDGAITSPKLATGSVTGDVVAPDAITTTHILDGAVTAGKLGANAVDSNNITPGAISADKLGINSVGASAIQANAVTASELADGAVDELAILDGAVTTLKLAPNSVTGGRIADAQIDERTLKDGQVTPAKLDRAYALAAHEHNFSLMPSFPVTPRVLGASASNLDVQTITLVSGVKYKCRLRVDVRAYAMDGVPANGILRAKIVSAIGSNVFQFDGGVDSTMFAIADYTTAGGTTFTISWEWLRTDGRIEVTAGVMEVICIPIR